jgi:hypothetical protein
MSSHNYNLIRIFKKLINYIIHKTIEISNIKIFLVIYVKG